MRLIKILRDERGSVLPETAGSWIVFAIMLAICLSVVGAVNLKNELDNAANNVARVIASDGTYDAGEQQKVAAYLQRLHLVAQVTVSPAENTYNLGDPVDVTLSLTTSLGLGGYNGIALPIKGYGSAESEVYEK